MAISYVGIASTPTTTGGSNATSPTAITPPSMQSGDLVIVVCHNRLSTDTHAVSQAGGQSWTKLTTNSSGNSTTTWFYCVFNGSWSANPSFSHGGTNNTCMMMVFRPTTNYLWRVDVSENPTDFTAPTTPFDVTITGITAGTASVAIAHWGSSDDNTWAYQSGTSWTEPTGATINNLSGQDSGLLMAYRLMPSGGSTGSPVGRQTTNGGDAGTRNIMSFQEYTINTYNDSQTDAGTAVDSHSAVQETQRSQTDAGTAVDTNQDAQGNYTSSQTDAGNAVESSDSTGTYAVTQTDAGNAVDPHSAVQVTQGSQTDAGSAVDLSDAARAVEVSQTDAGNAVEAVNNGIVTRTASQTDAGNAVEVTDGLRTTASTQTDAGTAVESSDAPGIYTRSQTDAGTAVESSTAVQQTQRSQTDAGNAVESSDAPGASYHMAQTEAVTATDTHDGEKGGIQSASQDEAANAVDIKDATGSYSVAQTDTGNAVDVPNFGSLSTNSAQTDTGNAVEVSTVAQTTNSSQADNGNAVEASQVSQQTISSITEAVTATESAQGGMIMPVSQTDLGNAVEVTDGEIGILEPETGDITIYLFEEIYGCSEVETAHTCQLSDMDTITCDIDYQIISVEI